MPPLHPLCHRSTDDGRWRLGSGKVHSHHRRRRMPMRFRPAPLPRCCAAALRAVRWVPGRQAARPPGLNGWDRAERGTLESAFPGFGGGTPHGGSAARFRIPARRIANYCRPIGRWVCDPFRDFVPPSPARLKADAMWCATMCSLSSASLPQPSGLRHLSAASSVRGTRPAATHPAQRLAISSSLPASPWPW